MTFTTLRAGFEYGSGLLHVGGEVRPAEQWVRDDLEDVLLDELHKAILDYLRMLGVPRRHEELTYHAHPLPLWNGMDRIQTRDNRVLLAGDAAGLINPLFGDGILHALKSGQIAARCLLDDNVAGYRDGSPLTHAHKLKGHLLVVHGTADDNVHYANTEALVNELIAHNKPFTMMAYPNRSHAINQGANTRRHLFTLLTRFLQERVPAGPRPK